MGQVVKEPLPPISPQVIDYATYHRSDFGDMYLVAKCKFFLGSSGGILAVSYIFNTPVAHTNIIPLRHIPFEKHDIFIPKKLWNIEQERWFTFPEIIDSGMDIWTNAEWFRDGGVQVVENTSEEVLSIAKEMHARLDGTWVTTEEDEHLQQQFKNLFPPSHHCHGFPARIGADFLRQNKELLH
jgi:putative glycosyltransferase (TIGR04372 family)